MSLGTKVKHELDEVWFWPKNKYEVWFCNLHDFINFLYNDGNISHRVSRGKRLQNIPHIYMERPGYPPRPGRMAGQSLDLSRIGTQDPRPIINVIVFWNQLIISIQRTNCLFQEQTVKLRLRKPKNDRKVQWESGTVDNEHMNKKKSKCEYW